MKTLYFDFYDESRQRQVPVSVYLPEKEGNNHEMVVLYF